MLGKATTKKQRAACLQKHQTQTVDGEDRASPELELPQARFFDRHPQGSWISYAVHNCNCRSGKDVGVTSAIAVATACRQFGATRLVFATLTRVNEVVPDMHNIKTQPSGWHVNPDTTALEGSTDTRTRQPSSVLLQVDERADWR